MNQASQELLELLDLEPLEVDLFRGIGTGGKPARGFLVVMLLLKRLLLPIALSKRVCAIPCTPILFGPAIRRYQCYTKSTARVMVAVLQPGAWLRCKTANRY